MIIGLCGVAGSGKDTAADVMVRNGPFVKVAFADPLKRIAFDVYDFSEEQLWGPSAMRNAPDERYPRPHGPYSGEVCTCCGVNPYKGNGKIDPCFLTPRFALQQLGSEWGRGCYPPTWVEYALRVAHRLGEGGHVYHYRRGLSSFYVTGMEAADAIERSKRSAVISDVRFENEVVAIKKAGGKVFRLLRGKGLEGGAGTHRSETELQGIPLEAFDRIIDNNAMTLQEFESFMVGVTTQLHLEESKHD